MMIFIEMMIMIVLKWWGLFLRINPESWIQFGEELGVERQLQIHSRFVKKRERCNYTASNSEDGFCNDDTKTNLITKENP